MLRATLSRHSQTIKKIRAKENRGFGSVATKTSLVQSDSVCTILSSLIFHALFQKTASGTVYGGIHTVTLIPGDGVGLEMATSVKSIFKAAHVPVEWEQFDITGYTDSKDDTKLRQALDSIRKNKVALKGKFRFDCLIDFAAFDLQR